MPRIALGSRTALALVETPSANATAAPAAIFLKVIIILHILKSTYFLVK
ncbi:MAG: hypothetical protein HKM94_02185 [Halobacteria archaeon]|nr:hypothetical protein [Halobacteria archaeon]